MTAPSWNRRAFLGAVLAAPLARAGQPGVVTYPRPERNDHAYHGRLPEHYPIRLLELALERAGRADKLRPASFMMTQSRCLLELQAGRSLDVMWTMTSRQREQELLPVRIPIYRGLIGWRLLLVRARDVGRFRALRSLEDLRAMIALQGHDWPDTQILRANGFRVQTAADYAGMFKMLASGRIDYFPRAVNEIWNEAEAAAADGLVIEPTLALHYPTAFYFFVNKSNTALAAAIETGLNGMLADGSFERLFNEYHGEILAKSGLHGRRVFELANPLLPEATPLGRRELWYTPERGTGQLRSNRP
ncbi:MAG: substrate-binding periplasmic protein [Telluria sp.]